MSIKFNGKKYTLDKASYATNFYFFNTLDDNDLYQDAEPGHEARVPFPVRGLLLGLSRKPIQSTVRVRAVKSSSTLPFKR